MQCPTHNVSLVVSVLCVIIMSIYVVYSAISLRIKAISVISKDTPTYRVTFLAALYRPAAIEALDSSK